MREVTILTPYSGDGSEASPYGPEVLELMASGDWTDITARPMQGGKPGRNMYAIKATLSDDDIRAIRQDSRFFISAKPEPAYRATDVDQWLKSRGFTDHPVRQGDTEAQATEKLKGYFRGL